MGAPEYPSHRAHRGGPNPYTTDELPRFKYGQARPPDRYTEPIDHDAANESHLRAVRTGEMPAVRVIDMPDPWSWWDSAILWTALVCSLLSLAVTGVVAVQVMQIRQALQHPIYVPADQVSPAPFTE